MRYNAGLDEADAKIVELLARYKNINLSDKSQWANTSFAFTRQLYNMLELGRVIVQGARQRDESRGAHYKPDFPNRNDDQFLKTTKAAYIDGAPAITYEEVDTQLDHPPPPRLLQQLDPEGWKQGSSAPSDRRTTRRGFSPGALNYRRSPSINRQHPTGAL